MFFNQDRDSIRRFYVECRRKAEADAPLDPVEELVAGIIAEHPEYHAALEDGDDALTREYGGVDGEPNPFLHMGLHVAIREQVMADRPGGIARIHEGLTRALESRMSAEHRMMDCLAETLWAAQQAGTEPDERAYYECLENLERALAY